MNTDKEKQYAERDLMDLDAKGNHYCRHVMAMTSESLHSKSDIAAELGWRDLMISELKGQIEESRREFRSADITKQNLEAQLKQSKIDADCYKKGMEASNARLVQIAAELSAIDAIHNDAVFITDAHYEQCPPEAQKIIGALAVLKIPAYKAFLSEVRAQGVDEIAELFFTLASHEANRIIADSWRESARFAKDHAAQLRKGGAE